MNYEAEDKIRAALRDEPDEVRAAFEENLAVVNKGGAVRDMLTNPWREGERREQADFWREEYRSDDHSEIKADAFEAYLRARHPDLLKPQYEEGLYQVSYGRSDEQPGKDFRLVTLYGGEWRDAGMSSSPSSRWVLDRIENGDWKLRRLVFED